MNIELVNSNLTRLNENQDKMIEKLDAIHAETLKTNGRVTALEKDNRIIWVILKWAGITLAVVVLALVAKGIIQVPSLPIG